jgi:hypothetical protein
MTVIVKALKVLSDYDFLWDPYGKGWMKEYAVIKLDWLTVHNIGGNYKINTGRKQSWKETPKSVPCCSRCDM